MTAPADPREARLRRAFEAFNARDADAVLAEARADVDWPSAWEGARVRGHDAVRDYWRRQWAAIDPAVHPQPVTARPDGRIAVHVRQVVRALDGSLLHKGPVVHVYTFTDGLVSRMDVEDPPAPA